MASPTGSGSSEGASIGTGAATGAAAGAMFGPWGALIGAGVGAVGGYVQGQGAKSAANAQAAASQYKAGIALINKQINEQNANFALETGQIESEERGLAGQQEVANTEVNQAAAGFRIGEGTNAAVVASQQWATTFDQNVISWDAAKTAWGYEAKAATDQAESTLDLMGASSEKAAGTIAATSSYLNAGSNVASKWYQGQSTGVFSSNSGSPGIGVFANGGNTGAPPTWQTG